MNGLIEKFKHYSVIDWLSIVGSICSIVGLFLYFKDNGINESQSYIINTTIFLCSGGFLIICYFLFVNKKTYTRFEKIRSFYSPSHKINHQYRNYVFKLDKHLEETLKNIDSAKDIVSLNLAKELSKTNSRDYFLKFFRILINEVKKQFCDYLLLRDINENIRISLKLVNPTSNPDIREWEVITAYRDQDTFDSIGLGSGDDPHLIKDNTAFDSIAYHLEDVFFSNDLVALGNQYRNTSRNWEKNYNSTIVVPIRYLPEKKEKT